MSLDVLRRKITSASKWTRWLWCGIFVALVSIVLVGFFLRRRAILNRVSQLRLELERKQRQLEDAAVAAETARHEGAIDKHAAAAAAIREDVERIEKDIVALEGEHAEILKQIEAARTWDDLDAARQAGNSR